MKILKKRELYYMKSKDRITTLWATIKESLPELKKELKEILINNK